MLAKKDTIARTVVLFLALVNQVMAILGRETLPFAENEIYQVISLLITFASSLVAWWKNNSFTSAAVMADMVKDDLVSQKREESMYGME